jgi:type I restriction enzyme M protein
MPILTQQQLETHLWGAANILRGKTAGQDYKTYILTLMFFKRLSDQWDAEAEENISKLEQQQQKKFSDAQRKTLMASPNIHRFKVPDGCHWAEVLPGVNELGLCPEGDAEPPFLAAAVEELARTTA